MSESVINIENNAFGAIRLETSQNNV